MELDAEIDRAKGLAQQAEARPNPTVNLYTENVGGSGPYSGFGRAETTLQVNQPIEIGGKRGSRVAAITLTGTGIASVALRLIVRGRPGLCRR